MAHSIRTRKFPLTCLLAFFLVLTLSGCEWELFNLGDGKDGDDDEELSPVTSQVTGLELGVSDLEMSLRVYRSGLDMRIVERITTNNSIRVILESPGSSLQATLTLVEYTDGLGRNLQDNPGKIVFYTQDAEALANQFDIAGGRITLFPTEQPGFGKVGFGRDPDNNLIEIAEAEVPLIMLVAVGIGASDLDAARDFYRDQVGLTEKQFIETARYDEYIMGTPEGLSSLSLVLMHWTDDVERRYQSNETSIQLISEDPDDVIERTSSEDDKQTQDPDGNRLIIDEEPADLSIPDSGD